MIFMKFEIQSVWYCFLGFCCGVGAEKVLHEMIWLYNLKKELNFRSRQIDLLGDQTLFVAIL